MTDTVHTIHTEGPEDSPVVDSGGTDVVGTFVVGTTELVVDVVVVFGATLVVVIGTVVATTA